MAESLKTFFSESLVRRLAKDVSRVHPDFPARAFTRRATTGLDSLELLARGRHIATALGEYLPPGYPEAVDVLMRSLGPEFPTDEMVGAGMAPFYYLPHVIFVAEYGLDHFDLSMTAQYELTKRFSAEFSIRQYLDRYPDRTMAVLREWTADSSAHVRRLTSEGTRLRLPWAPRVKWLERNPERVIEILEVLKDDPSTYVRRSVANNLNDLGKVYPELLIRTGKRWLKGATDARRRLITHALRSAVKRADPGALRLLGYGSEVSVKLERVRIEPKRVRIGGRVSIEFSVLNTGSKKQEMLVDLIVHFVKARRQTSAKVFKLGRAAVQPGDRVEFRKTISLAVHTTRKPYPGTHHVEAQVNGKALRLGAFEVK